MSPVLDCTAPAAYEGAVSSATFVIRRGGLVVMPTDTVYGLAADAFDVFAVQRLLEAKGRGREMPVTVLVPSRRTVDGLASRVPEFATRLMEEFWPGGLTLIFPAHTSLSWDLGETKGTVALRVPDHPLALALLEETGPLAVTSANITGEPSATTVAEAAAMLGSKVDVYLDAGASPGSVASTIVDCTGEAPSILRDGVIPASEIERVAGVGQADGAQ